MEERIRRDHRAEPDSESCVLEPGAGRLSLPGMPPSELAIWHYLATRKIAGLNPVSGDLSRFEGRDEPDGCFGLLSPEETSRR